MSNFRFSKYKGLSFCRYLIFILGLLLTCVEASSSEKGLRIISSISLNYIKSNFINGGEKQTYEIHNVGKIDILSVTVICSYGRNGKNTSERIIVDKVIRPKEKYVFSFFIPDINQIHPSGVIVGIENAEFASPLHQ